MGWCLEWEERMDHLFNALKEEMGWAGICNPSKKSGEIWVSHRKWWEYEVREEGWGRWSSNKHGEDLYEEV